MKQVFLCAITDSPYLVISDGHATERLLPSEAIIGPAFFPRVAPTGSVAYLTRGPSEGSSEWLSSIVVTTPQFEVVDLLPRAASFSPPAWTSDGQSVVFVRTDPRSHIRHAVSYETSSGNETTLFSCSGLRSLGIVEEDCLIYSTHSGIYERALSTAQVETLFHAQVSDWFARFGTDDIFVTQDQLAPSLVGALAFVSRWTRPGRATHEDVMVLENGGLSMMVQRPARCPRWLCDGSLAVATDDGINVLQFGKQMWSIPVPTLHSFDVLSRT